MDHHHGFMPGGNDLHNGRMSLAEARQWCIKHPECLGFTFAGPPGTPPEDALLDVHFKTAGEWAPGEGWHSFVKAPAVTLIDNAGFMPKGNDLHNGRMRLAEGKQWCIKHPECKGFTFAGPPGTPPDDALLDMHFKTSGEWAPGEGWHSFVKASSSSITEADRETAQALDEYLKREIDAEETRKADEAARTANEAQRRRQTAEAAHKHRAAEAEQRMEERKEREKRQAEEQKRQERPSCVFIHHPGFMPAGHDVHTAHICCRQVTLPSLSLVLCRNPTPVRTMSAV
jgi:hypothetical protein